MKSRLLTRLDAGIAAAPNRLTGDSLRCERAAYLARIGELEQAATDLAGVRERHLAKPRAALSAWLNIADAQLAHYTDLGPAAVDRMRRAHAIARASALQPLQALAAAWLAHFAYLRMDASASAGHAAEALSLAAPDHHAARARACLVIAQGYHEGGRHDLARPWYTEAHRHASVEGDEATLSALLWNSASLRLVNLRQALSSNAPDKLADGSGEAGASGARGASGASGGSGAFAAPGASEKQALLSADSTAHFDDLAGMHSLPSLLGVLRAQVYTALERTAEALPLFEADLEPALLQGQQTIEGSLRADRGWCRWQAGDAAGARADAALADAALATGAGAPGDRAPGHDQLARLFVALGEAAPAQRHGALAAQAWSAHRVEQRAFIEALDAAFGDSPLAAGKTGRPASGG